MSKSVKDVYAIEGAAGLREKLKELTTTEIAEQLTLVYTSATDGLGQSTDRVFAMAEHEAINDCEKVYEEHGKAGSQSLIEALDTVMAMIEKDTLHIFLRLAAHVAAGSYLRGSQYVAMAMSYYESASVETALSDLAALTQHSQEQAIASAEADAIHK